MNILFLLIGSNPLPNYIVAKYLLSVDAKRNNLPVPDKIICIHTDKTKKFADTLSNVLPASATMIEKFDLGQNGRNPKRICAEITKKLQQLENEKSEIRSIHLNYIGGTKTMAVQAALLVSEWAKGKPKFQYILSDVDPALRKITFSETGLVYPVIGDLRDKIKLTTEELLQLHGMKVHHLGSKAISASQTDLMCFCQQLWSKYNNSNPKKFSKRLGTLSRRFNSLKEKDEKATERKILANDKIMEDIDYFKAEIPQLASMFQIGNTPNLAMLVYLTGGWLEELIHLSLIKLQQEVYPEIHEIRRNVKAEYEHRTTEIDVIAIQGYELFLFSCTTSNRIGTVKQKAFEALFRAEQLGGEHAKVVVVSTLYNDYNSNEPDNSYQNVHNLQELKKDLAQFDAERNCRLTGLDELVGEINGKKTLTNKIKYILEGGK